MYVERERERKWVYHGVFWSPYGDNISKRVSIWSSTLTQKWVWSENGASASSCSHQSRCHCCETKLLISVVLFPETVFLKDEEEDWDCILLKGKECRQNEKAWLQTREWEDVDGIVSSLKSTNQNALKDFEYLQLISFLSCLCFYSFFWKFHPWFAVEAYIITAIDSRWLIIKSMGFTAI